MRVLFLGPSSPTLEYLQANEEVDPTEQPITPQQASSYDMLVSHGYRHIIKPDVLSVARAVNLHISYLPWNRGADPNLWSWIDDTPKGVSIHWIDEGIDTGPLIAQRRAAFENIDARTSLALTYEVLQLLMVELFIEWWPRIRSSEAPAIPQEGRGSFHLSREGAEIRATLPNGWDTPVQTIWASKRSLPPAGGLMLPPEPPCT